MTGRPEDGRADEPINPDRVVFRDKRKIDPVTGEVRKPAPTPEGMTTAPAAQPQSDPVAATATEVAAESAEVAALQAALAERTADVQRIQAEYANYRKRSERDRLAVSDLAVSRVLVDMVPVLDDIDRARSHGDLTGALKAVADHLESIFSKLGLQAFGEVGDPFDPAIHEAVLHAESDEVSVPTSTTVMRQGYRHGERLIRPAMVGVTEPAHQPSQDQSQDQEDGDPAPADGRAEQDG